MLFVLFLAFFPFSFMFMQMNCNYMYCKGKDNVVSVDDYLRVVYIWFTVGEMMSAKCITVNVNENYSLNLMVSGLRNIP